MRIFVQVHPLYTPKIVGTRGTNIKPIQAESETKIWSPKRDDPSCMFEITGSEEGVDFAEMAIRSLEQDAAKELEEEKKMEMKIKMEMEQKIMPQLSEEPYDLELEKQALMFILNLCKRNGLTYCQFSWLLRALEANGDEELLNYVGAGLPEMIEFLLGRRYLFFVSEALGNLSLMPAFYYATLCHLNEYIRANGGACSMQQFYEDAVACPEMPPTVTQSEMAFLQRLQEHPSVFRIFPSGNFVSSLRQLIEFDYPAYMHENFGDAVPDQGFVATNGLDIIKEMAAEMGLGVPGLISALRSPTAHASAQTEPDAALAEAEGRLAAAESRNRAAMAGLTRLRETVHVMGCGFSL